MVKPAKWKGYAVLAAVFLLGAATGGGVVFSVAQRRHAAMMQDPKEMNGRRLNALSRKLDLDEDQKTKISEILSKDREDRRAEVEAQIRAVLRPEQQTKFDEMIEQRKEHRHGGRGPR